MKVFNMKVIYLFIIILSIYKSCDWILHEMVVEIVFNNEIQIHFLINLYF